MLLNFIKISLRGLVRNKNYTIINIVGLSLGIAVCLMILTYVTNELSYESFHKNKADIVRIAVDFGPQNSKMRMAGAMPALAPKVIEQLPEVVDAARLKWEPPTLLHYDGNKIYEESLFFTDQSLFDIFTFSAEFGDLNTALKEPYSVVLTKETALKYFGEQNPLGKTLLLNGEYPLKISAVLDQIPSNTHLKFNMLVSYSSLEPMGKAVQMPWNQFGDYLTYFRLKNNTDRGLLNDKLQTILSQNANQYFAENISFNIQPLTEIHMSPALIGDMNPSGNMTYVILFSAIAALVLLIACFNYINLTTAGHLRRLKEITMRRLLGADKIQLIRQFLGESMLVTVISVAIGLLLFELFFPIVNSIIGNGISVGNLNYMLLFIPIIILVVGILAGIYPAWYLSKSAKVDSTGIRAASIGGRSVLRKILVVAQFAISIFMIIGTIVVYQQINYVRNTEFGFDKDDVVLIRFPTGYPDVKQNYPILKDNLLKNPAIEYVSGAYTVPGVSSNEKKYITSKVQFYAPENGNENPLLFPPL